jgi:hypothetical protein
MLVEKSSLWIHRESEYRDIARAWLARVLNGKNE